MQYYLAIGLHSWGKGNTISEAVNNAKKNDSRKKRLTQKNFFLYESDDPNIHCNDMGGAVWKKNSNSKKIQNGIA